MASFTGTSSSPLVVVLAGPTGPVFFIQSHSLPPLDGLAASALLESLFGLNCLLQPRPLISSLNPAPQAARRILVTSALPYANGQIHIGHLVEYIQTDIWVRALRMHGHEVYYVGADDTHGTPIMLRAEQEGITPKQLIERVGKEHERDFDSFGISFDNYYSTDAEENRVLCESIYGSLKAAGLIEARDI